MPPKRAAASKKASGSDVFADKVFCLSGSLTKTRDEITELLQDNGGTVASSVTKKVTHLVTTAEDFAAAPAKVEKAKENGIFIVNEDYIHDSISADSAKKEDSYLLNKKRKADAEEAEEEEEEEEEEEAEVKPKAKKGGKKAAAAKKGAKKAKKDEAEEEEDAEEEKPKPKAKKGAKSAAVEDAEEEEKPAAPTKGEKDDSDEEEDPASKKKIVVKGKAAVDNVCAQHSTCHVLEAGKIVYDAMLNQTNIGQNNNKFYIIQVLEKDGGGGYYSWNRWGRIGERGQNKLMPCATKEKAIADFEKKFKDKTKNDWRTVGANRDAFKSVAGKYTLIEIDYGADNAEEEKPKAEKKEKKTITKTKSNLDQRVQDLVNLIFDRKMMNNIMSEMEFDVKKSPLGQLTKKQIKAGYEVLKEIDEVLKKNSKAGLSELSSRFYTLIPHSFGRNVPPVINNAEMLKKKMAMLEALADIEIANKLMEKVDDEKDEVDEFYAKLKCAITPIEKDSEEFKQIQTYVTNTHQGTVPKIKNVYAILREGEKERFESSTNLGNRKLLWHGSRLTNYVGIISQGLRIAPPEAPVSGYRFGKGIYFADIMSLSSIYCRSAGSNDFCMLLGDVVLGKEAELNHDTYMEKPQSGTHSTKALGTIEPSKGEEVTHKDGYVIPCGKIVDSGKKGVSCKEHQYIVYDVSQAHLKYLLHLNWE